MTDTTVVLRVEPFGKNNWNVWHIHGTRKKHFAGHIERHKTGVLVRFWAYDDEGALLGKEYLLQQGVERIRKRHYRHKEGQY